MRFSSPPPYGFDRRAFWRAWFDHRRPEGRFAILAACLFVLLMLSLVRNFREGGVSDTLAPWLGRLLAVLVGFTLHEWAHAQMAYRLGGWSALPDSSRLSLDPRVHLDPLGLVAGLAVGLAWARPVPVNPGAFYPYERRNMMLVALAGPLMNLALGFSVALLLRWSNVIGDVQTAEGPARFLLLALASFVYVNLALFIFNLLPLSPLDGWKILLGLLPNEQSIVLARYEQVSNMLLLFMVLLSFVRLPTPLGVLIYPLADALYLIMTGFAY